MLSLVVDVDGIKFYSYLHTKCITLDADAAPFELQIDMVGLVRNGLCIGCGDARDVISSA